MTYTMHYDSPLGGILLAADEEGLTGLWFETQKYFAAKLAPEHEEKMTPALDAACRKYGPSATVLAMPHGGSTLPYLQDAGPDHSRT